MDATVPRNFPYLLPSSPTSLLAALQVRGYLTRAKSAIVGDFLLLSGGLMVLFHGASYVSGIGSVLLLVLSLVFVALLYSIGFLIYKGAVTRMLAMMFLLGFLSAASGIFPILGILLMIVVFCLMIRRVMSLLSLIPWVGASIVFYFFLLNATQHEPINVVETFENQWLVSALYSLLVRLLPYERYWWVYILFSMGIALYCTASFPLSDSLFRIALMLGTAPIIALFLLLHMFHDSGDVFGDHDLQDSFDHSSDTSWSGHHSDALDHHDHSLVDGIPSLDVHGLRIDYPDGSHIRWVESNVIRPHWRFYS